MTEAEAAAEKYVGRRVLITGGLGFIGSTLAHAIVPFATRVTLIDSLIPDYGGNLYNIATIADRVNVNISDVRDRYAMNYLVQGHDVMFNLAGTLSHVDSMLNPQIDLEINCNSQLSILEACRANNRDIKIIFAGTRGQYGRAQYLPVDEKHPTFPTDVNGINNNAGEAYHLLYNDVYGLRATSLRLTNTFGPRHQMRHHRQGIINWFIRLALEGKPITIYGDGTQVRDTNYVTDVVRALLLAGADERTNGEVYNIGGEPTDLLQLAQLISSLADSPGFSTIPYPDDAKAIEIGDYVADWSKAKTVLGWHPRVSLKQGIRMTIDYYRKHHEHYW